MTGRSPHASTETFGGHTPNLSHSLPLPSSLIDAIADQVAHRVAELLPDRPEPYLDVEGAAEYLACAPKRVYDLKAQGRLAHHRDGSRLLFRREDLDAALVRQEAERD